MSVVHGYRRSKQTSSGLSLSHDCSIFGSASRLGCKTCPLCVFSPWWIISKLQMGFFQPVCCPLGGFSCSSMSHNWRGRTLGGSPFTYMFLLAQGWLRDVFIIPSPSTIPGILQITLLAHPALAVGRNKPTGAAPPPIPPSSLMRQLLKPWPGTSVRPRTVPGTTKSPKRFSQVWGKLRKDLHPPATLNQKASVKKNCHYSHIAKKLENVAAEE